MQSLSNEAEFLINQSIRKFSIAQQENFEYTFKKALGLNANDAIPAGDSDYPRAVYHKDYFAATTDEERAANAYTINSAAEEKELGEGWYLSAAEAKKAARAAGVETEKLSALEIKKRATAKKSK